MDQAVITVRMDLPREALDGERAASGPDYRIGQETPLPQDPDAAEAHFIDPVSIIVVGTLAVILLRIVDHLLTRDGTGMLIDTRETPPLVSRLADVADGTLVIVKPDGSTEMHERSGGDRDTVAGLVKAALAGAAA